MKKFYSLSTINLLICSLSLLIVMGPVASVRAQPNNAEVTLVPVDYDSSDQVVTILNKTGREIDLSGFKINDGSGNVFKFPPDKKTLLKPFGVIRVHSGSDARGKYSERQDFFWTQERIWGKKKTARLVSSSGKVVSELDLSATEATDLLAGCLTRKEVKMYGLTTCPHCQAQKDKFDTSFRYVNYVECTENRRTCIDAGVSRVPEWLFGEIGKRKIGSRSLEQLSNLAGCSFHN
jgi:glutaredoxin